MSIETLNVVKESVDGAFAGRVFGSAITRGELTVIARREDIVELMRFLRDDPALQFVSFIDLCGVDYPERAERFEVVYHLLSPRKNVRIRVKVSTDEETPVPSITGVFAGADWFEREA